MIWPQSSEPQSSEPQSSEPQSSEPQSSEPQSSEYGNSGARPSSAREQFTPVGLGIAGPRARSARPRAASLSLPGLSLPGLSLQGLSLPGLSLPGLSLQGLSLPGLSLPGLSLPGLSLQGLSLQGLSVRKSAAPVRVGDVRPKDFGDARAPQRFLSTWLKPAPDVHDDRLCWQLTEHVGAAFAATNKALSTGSLDSGLAAALRKMRPPTSLCSAARSARAWLRHFERCARSGRGTQTLFHAASAHMTESGRLPSRVDS